MSESPRSQAFRNRRQRFASLALGYYRLRMRSPGRFFSPSSSFPRELEATSPLRVGLRRRRIGSILVFGATLTTLSACADKKAKTRVELAEPESEGATPGEASSDQALPAEHAPVRKIHLRASLQNPADLLAAALKLSKSWSKEGSDAESLPEPMAMLELVLSQAGFGPGFLEGLDLSGTFVSDAAWPQPGQPHARPNDFELSAYIPTVDGKRVIDALPPDLSPQPRGQDIWEIGGASLGRGTELLLRKRERHIELGSQMADLDRAPSLLEDIDSNTSLQLRAWGLPADDIDPSPLLTDLPASSREAWAEVIRETTALTGELDLGTDRDLIVSAGAEAPVEKVGSGYFGPKLRDSGTLTPLLPPKPVIAFEVAFGDAATYQQALDRFPTEELPPPFDEAAEQLLSANKMILEQIKDRAVSAMYMDEKGNASLLLAAHIGDEEKTRAALRRIYEALESSLVKHKKSVASDPKMRYRVTYRPDGLTFGKGKVDRFAVTLPPAATDEMGPELEALFGKKKPRIEVVSFVRDDFVVITAGAGSRRLMSQVHKRLIEEGKPSLASDPGLTLARKTTDGCQVCIAVDPKAFVRFGLSVDNPKGRAAHERSLAELEVSGQIAGAFLMEPGRVEGGFGVSKELLYAPPKVLRALYDALNAVGDDDVEVATPVKKKN